MRVCQGSSGTSDDTCANAWVDPIAGVQYAKPDELQIFNTPAAGAEGGQQANLRLQPGYDHSYFFVSTFMEDHVSFHAEALYAG